MKINRVVVTIYPPREADNFPGQVEEGYYLREDNVVRLVSHAGVPIARRNGKTYSKTLAAGESPYMVAGRLLKEHYHSRREKNQFSRPLHYPKLGIV